MADQILGYTDLGNSEKIWYVTKADNCEKWLVTTSSYDCLKEFEENHKFTITMEELESLVDNEVNLEAFRKQYCSTCGSQRCDGSLDWLEGCGKWREYQNM